MEDAAVANAEFKSARSDFVFGVLSLLLVLGGLVICLRPVVFPSRREISLRRLLAALEIRLPASLALAERHLELFPGDEFGLTLAAQAATINLNDAAAVKFLSRLPQDRGRWEFIAELELGQRFDSLGKLGKAESHFRRALKIFPDDLEANERLGHILQVEGRVWEAAPYFFRQIQRGKCRGDELLCLATAESFFRREERWELGHQGAGTPDIAMKLAAARNHLGDNRSSEAEKLLRELLSERPELSEARGRLGRIIVERGDLGEFLQWRGGLPDEARDHPEVWFVQGLKARRLGQLPGAIRCFAEALERSPNHVASTLQIAGCLEQVGQAELAHKFSRRAELLADIEGMLNAIRSDGDPQKMAKLVTELGELGRYWEAAGWSFVMSRLDIPREAPRREFRHWLRFASLESAPNAMSHQLSSLIDRQQFAPPDWPTPSEPITVAELPPAETEVAWNITDDTERLGIRFSYEEGTTENSRLEHIFNVMGGGVGVIDYDIDGWPDLYLAQANNWRDPSPQIKSDRMFHNVLGERFEDVTSFCVLGDVNFSHGVTVGDFDQDGFPDLYVGNKGPNCLFHNNGDGTFEETSAVAGVAGNEWTTSSVFADFNGDSLPDLYVANYTKLLETAQKECKDSKGERGACTPKELPAEHDRMYVNNGNGSFRDVSEAAGILAPDGRGLGIVVWDFNGDGRLDIFVANDTTANFLFLHEYTDSNGVPHFQEQAIVRGVAFDEDGHPQASMGIAAGDANGDGRIDLFITNFFAESNILYSQRSDGFFDDMTRTMDLRDAGFSMVGFGCQFADFDGDGWEDLVVTNGHVDQQTPRGDPDRMRPQLFRNQNGRKFVEVPSEKLGAFFQNRYLGRSLATLDWNRDGRTDVAISHLHAPFSLLTNKTPQAAHPLVIRLQGRKGERDPIGAIVRVRADRQTATRMCTAGDGFLVTNERRLQFAIPLDQTTVEVEVQWLGGTIQRWRHVPIRSEVVLIEDRSDVVILRRFVVSTE